MGGAEGGDRAWVEKKERGKTLHLGDPSGREGAERTISCKLKNKRELKRWQATTMEYHSATETRTLLTDTTPSEKARHQGTHAAR